MQSQSEQSDDLFDVIPRYREAVQKERYERDRAFIPGASESILGIEVLPMTFGHMLLLSSIGSPFVTTGVPSPDSVLEFVWCVSREYAASMRLKRALDPWAPRLSRWLFRKSKKRFGRKLRIGRAFKDWVLAIRDYVDGAFMDGPKGAAKGVYVSYLSGMALSIKILYDDLGITQEQALAMPLKQFFQHERRIRMGTDRSAILWNNLSDGVRDAWLCQKNQTPDEQRRN